MLQKRITGWLNKPHVLKHFMSLYGPYFGAGIKVEHISMDFRYARVSMRLRWYNRNYVGTHFGGSLYSMTDPFFMLLIMNNLGTDYIVWDKQADIDFIKPGKGKVTAEFHLTESMLDDIQQHTAKGDKYLPTYPVLVKDEQGEVVAQVNKVIYIRKKPPKQNKPVLA